MSTGTTQPYGNEDSRSRAVQALKNARLDPGGIIWGKRKKDDKRSAWRTLGVASNQAAQISVLFLLTGDDFGRSEAEKWAEATRLLNWRKARFLKDKQRELVKGFR